MKSKRYKNVEAIRLSQDNVFDVASWSGAGFHILPEGNVRLVMATPEGRVWADDGDWIFKDKQGAFRAFTDEAFRESYFPKARRAVDEKKDD